LGRIVNTLVGGVLAALGFVWLVSLAGVLYFAWRDVRSPGRAILVLGAAQYDGRPSPVLKARLDHAVALWRADTARTLVLTGGTGTGDTTSEAAVGRAYVRKLGVPDARILLEREGRTTSASMAGASAILRSHRLTTVIMVSDRFHMFRLWILARKHRLSVVTSPTHTSPIATRSLENLGYILSESLKAPIALFLE